MSFRSPPSAQPEHATWHGINLREFLAMRASPDHNESEAKEQRHGLSAGMEKLDLSSAPGQPDPLGDLGLVVLLDMLRPYHNLRTLDLSGNALTHLAALEAHEGELPQLRDLSLRRNRLTSIEGVEKLSSLVKLDVGGGGNQLKTLPPLTLPNLRTLDVSGNLLEIKEIGHLAATTKLVNLSVAGNPLTKMKLHKDLIFRRLPTLNLLDGAGAATASQDYEHAASRASNLGDVLGNSFSDDYPPDLIGLNTSVCELSEIGQIGPDQSTASEAQLLSGVMHENERLKATMALLERKLQNQECDRAETAFKLLLLEQGKPAHAGPCEERGDINVIDDANDVDAGGDSNDIWSMEMRGSIGAKEDDLLYQAKIMASEAQHKYKTCAQKCSEEQSILTMVDECLKEEQQRLLLFQDITTELWRQAEGALQEAKLSDKSLYGMPWQDMNGTKTMAMANESQEMKNVLAKRRQAHDEKQTVFVMLMDEEALVREDVERLQQKILDHSSAHKVSEETVYYSSSSIDVSQGHDRTVVMDKQKEQDENLNVMKMQLFDAETKLADLRCRMKVISRDVHSLNIQLVTCMPKWPGEDDLYCHQDTSTTGGTTGGTTSEGRNNSTIDEVMQDGGKLTRFVSETAIDFLARLQHRIREVKRLEHAQIKEVELLQHAIAAAQGNLYAAEQSRLVAEVGCEGAAKNVIALQLAAKEASIKKLCEHGHKQLSQLRLLRDAERWQKTHAATAGTNFGTTPGAAGACEMEGGMSHSRSPLGAAEKRLWSEPELSGQSKPQSFLSSHLASPRMSPAHLQRGGKVAATPTMRNQSRVRKRRGSDIFAYDEPGYSMLPPKFVEDDSKAKRTAVELVGDIKSIQAIDDRVFAARERLQQVRAMCKVTPATGVEHDPSGNSLATLTVNAVSAKDLPVGLSSQSAAPFVILKLIHERQCLQSYKTEAKHGISGQWPHWNETYRFEGLPSLDASLSISLHQRISAEPVGVASLSCRDFDHQQQACIWVGLNSRGSFGKLMPAVRLRVKLQHDRAARLTQMIEALEARAEQLAFETEAGGDGCGNSSSGMCGMDPARANMKLARNVAMGGGGREKSGSTPVKASDLLKQINSHSGNDNGNGNGSGSGSKLKIKRRATVGGAIESRRRSVPESGASGASVRRKGSGASRIPHAIHGVRDPER
ncbi:unnamed protein product, partial [Chrysoparadoxa australica]